MSRYTQPRRHFPWTPEELIAIWEIGATLRTDNEMAIERRFPSGEQVLLGLKNKYPGIVARYENKMGQPLPPKVVYDRLHKNYYGDLVNGRSPEHPHRHPVKRALLGVTAEPKTEPSEKHCALEHSVVLSGKNLKDLFSWSVGTGNADLALRIAKELLK